MKYEVGDKILVLLTNEEGKVVEIMNENLVMIEVKGVKFPAYTDQIDFPYFKMFTEQRKIEKKKNIFIDNVQKEKDKPKLKEGEGVEISFFPIYSKDVFDDDVVEKFKIFIINKNNEAYNFKYNLMINGKSDFELINTLEPLSDFYLHNVNFEDISDSPKFDFEFSLLNENKKKAPFFETSLKLKGKHIFKKLEEIQQKNEATFNYTLLNTYPDKVEEEKVDFSKLNNAGFRIFDAEKSKENIEKARSVVDLHIEKLTDDWAHLSNFEILSIQLNTFEKYFDLAITHYQPSLVIIHGVGVGKLRDEIHEILKLKKSVKSYVNQYNHLYGYGATEIFFQY